MVRTILQLRREVSFQNSQQQLFHIQSECISRREIYVRFNILLIVSFVNYVLLLMAHSFQSNITQIYIKVQPDTLSDWQYIYLCRSSLILKIHI